jgi:hypothetical protein
LEWHSCSRLEHWPSVEARYLAAGAGGAQNHCDRTELPEFVMLIACGASKEVNTNRRMLIQPQA